ncbi:hypothetical protein Y032_0004g1737 [Ancylostoma ceylanicum]|uniref:Uncharacterized protein n=1 Tax=Ancylostoma ceylanicum TaxID=53326 RepID=A0A016VTT1_9BILA|nr:hypothetical protein Y032_0004g1737 [Ancylostoma ceylanicum]
MPGASPATMTMRCSSWPILHCTVVCAKNISMSILYKFPFKINLHYTRSTRVHLYDEGESQTHRAYAAQTH